MCVFRMLTRALLPFPTLLLLLLLGAPLAQAQEVPPPVGYVNDFGNVLPEETEAELERMLSLFEQESTVELAVVTVPSLAGDTVEGYAERLFRAWGVGKKGVDNGVVLLLALEERQVRIEVGYGMEPYLPDGKVGRILDAEVVPPLRQGDYALGLLQGARGVVQAIQASDYQPGTVRPRPQLGAVAQAFAGKLWLLVVLAIASIYAFNYFTRSKVIWPGGVWGTGVGAFVGWSLGGVEAVVVGTALGGVLGLALDALLSWGYRYQKATGRPTAWINTWGGFSGAGHWRGGGGGGGGRSGGFSGGRSGGGGASRGF